VAFFIALPFEIRLLLLFVLGLAVGTQLNRGIYRLAFDRRSIGPWSRPAPEAPPRAYSDYLPVLGWFGLSRESSLHGPGYWLRPLVIELAAGLGFASLYAWETSGNLLPTLPPLTIAALAAAEQPRLHWECLAHLILVSLMTVATFIDFDEQTIPDEITVTGTLAALVLAAAVPASLMPTTVWPAKSLGPLLVSSPETWPDWLRGPWGLAAALGCYVGWCAAIVPSLWTTRHGLAKAIRYQLASMARTVGFRKKHPLRRQPSQPFYLVLPIVGLSGISAVWYFGGEHWQALETALIGMAFSGCLIWGVRIVGSAALGKEAMGFGDVTLMAMIGAFLGWQSSLLVFFLAPFAALFIAVSQWLLTRRHDIAFGPYLCFAALILIVRWKAIWHDWAEPIFWLGWLIPLIVLVCLALMGVLLFAWQAVKSRVFSIEKGR
jgi:leader peptidase (prepilin peptidase)/N-methyltransferase